MKCLTESCQNEAVEKRRYCSTCRSQKYRERHPLKYFYDTVKTNAKRRGKEFTLTFEEFKAFCEKTGYDKEKGRNANSLTIDRIKNHKGYSADNIQAITLSENIKKFNIEDFPDELKPRIIDAPF